MTDVDGCRGFVHSSFYTYKHIVQNLASCVGPLMSIGLFMIMGDVWTVRSSAIPTLLRDRSSGSGRDRGLVSPGSRAGGALALYQGWVHAAGEAQELS